jgi:hypothetical protein
MRNDNGLREPVRWLKSFVTDSCYLLAGARALTGGVVEDTGSPPRHYCCPGRKPGPAIARRANPAPRVESPRRWSSPVRSQCPSDVALARRSRILPLCLSKRSGGVSIAQRSSRCRRSAASGRLRPSITRRAYLPPVFPATSLFPPSFESITPNLGAGKRLREKGPALGALPPAFAFRNHYCPVPRDDRSPVRLSADVPSIGSAAWFAVA